mmetsp:Transcript_58671/g.102708  ORF Transcript_58671/g.102708 Transcript_58671/m.102708 type:complete len:152 (-) Transcript_58671:47-502(-)
MEIPLDLRINLVDEMEAWLASASFNSAWRECYDLACRGSGRSDRNISESILLQTAAALHDHLPVGALEMMIPEPDAEFVRGALEHICKENPQKAGFKDLEHFEAALVVVYVQLAHCAELMQRQMPEVSELLRLHELASKISAPESRVQNEK